MSSGNRHRRLDRTLVLGLVLVLAVTTFGAGCSSGKSGGSDAIGSSGDSGASGSKSSKSSGSKSSSSSTVVLRTSPSTTTTSLSIDQIGQIATKACTRVIDRNTPEPTDLPEAAVGPFRACVAARRKEKQEKDAAAQAAAEAEAAAEADNQAAAQNDNAGISLEEFDQIQVGMSLADVVALIGTTGSPTSDAVMPGTEVLRWNGDGSQNDGANATIIITDGKVVAKTNQGLT